MAGSLQGGINNSIDRLGGDYISQDDFNLRPDQDWSLELLFSTSTYMATNWFWNLVKLGFVYGDQRNDLTFSDLYSKLLLPTNATQTQTVDLGEFPFKGDLTLEMVLITYNASVRRLRVYVGDRLVLTYTYNYVMPDAFKLIVTNTGSISNYTSGWWNGLRLYQKELSQQEWSQLYASCYDKKWIPDELYNKVLYEFLPTGFEGLGATTSWFEERGNLKMPLLSTNTTTNFRELPAGDMSEYRTKTTPGGMVVGYRWANYLGRKRLFVQPQDINTSDVTESVDFKVYSKLKPGVFDTLKYNVEPYEGLFKIKLKFEKETTVYTPLQGWDSLGTLYWGDGTFVSGRDIVASSHTYQPGEYIMAIYSPSQGLDIFRVDQRDAYYRYESIQKYVTEIVSWGNNLGLKSISFIGTSISSIPEDTNGAFASLGENNSMFSNCPNIDKIPENLFRYAINMTGCSSLFSYCNKITSIPVGLFRTCTKLKSVLGAFRQIGTSSIPVGLFANNPELEDLYYTFYGTPLTSIPENLFVNNPNILRMEGTFSSTQIKEVPVGLFRNNINITNCTSLFGSCKSLVTVPSIFRTNINALTFQSTFNGCSAIVSLPEDLFRYCVKATSFYRTFEGCTSLTNGVTGNFFAYNTEVTTFGDCFKDSGLPQIPQGLFRNNVKTTTLSSTFRGCKKVTSIPSDLLSTLTNLNSITNIFQGTAISTVPEDLFINNLKITSTYSIFEDCYYLTQVPAGLLRNQVDLSGVQYMFRNCQTLQTIPGRLFSQNAQIRNFSSVLNGTGLTSIPEEIFSFAPEATNFNQCLASSKIVSIPVGLFKNNVQATDFGASFSGCDNLVNVPNDLFIYNVKCTTFGSLFSRCASLRQIPGGLFRNNSEVTTFQSTFSQNKSLYVPTEIFRGNKKVTTFENCFWISDMVGNVPLPTDEDGGYLWDRQGKAGYPATVNGRWCFRQSTGWLNSAIIPSTWK